MSRRAVVLVAAAGTIALLLLGSFLRAGTVTRADLGIAPADPGSACRRATLPFYRPYDQEVAANDHLVYALASLGAYRDPDVTRFVVTAYESGWERLKQPLTDDLVFDVYLKRGEVSRVIMAFRGTELSSVGDWLANLSWLTGPLGVPTRYDAARREFARLRREVASVVGDVPVTFVATGHSLGGGLAQHVAAGFPCVSAVVFDTSRVTNRYVFAEPYDDNVVVHLHDRWDELTWVQRLFSTEADGPTYRWYPLDLVPRGRLRHEILRFAVGMARMATNCQLLRPDGDRRCRIPGSDARARELYCPTHGHRDKVCQPVLRRMREREARR